MEQPAEAVGVSEGLLPHDGVEFKTIDLDAQSAGEDHLLKRAAVDRLQGEPDAVHMVLPCRAFYGGGLAFQGALPCFVDGSQ